MLLLVSPIISDIIIYSIIALGLAIAWFDLKNLHAGKNPEKRKTAS